MNQITCVVCGQECDWEICSDECNKKLKAVVEQIVKQEHPELIGKSLVLDPEVGDEYAIARLSAYSRIRDNLTRPMRVKIAENSMEQIGLAGVSAEHLVLLAERSPGSNTQDVEIDGAMYHVFESGLIKPIARGYGYHYRRVEGGWQEVRPDNDPYTRKFIADDQLTPTQYGEIAGADALSVIEHSLVMMLGATTEEE